MRIIGGKYKRSKLSYPRVRSVRPTMDRVKESMFNTIGDVIEGKEILSLFAGSGSLGIEALSRGAKHAVFVDQQLLSVQIIQGNLTRLGIPEISYEVLRGDALKLIETFHQKGRFFDFIFLDPPYYQDFIKKILMKLEAFDILTRFSYLVLEHAKAEPVPESKIFPVVRAKRFGETTVTICKKDIIS